ncbi:TlpA family protein disulfide reductase [Dawidia soli]|uniref:Redoxin domain-containing protein n=1 Tax=Dawidia soli TaxID=2782352 RepID=A0AAP2DGU8_9BACT|nr:redoxin domain-containing protein [Dawidia soli]MBT1689127.1 redoxin domain-containing protein [Dawidia soli]
MKFRKTMLLAFIILIVMLSVGFIFWQHELRYATPTPVPDGFVDVPLGAEIDLAAWGISSDRSTLLHFFNPRCPCSKFNMNEFRALVREYNEQVDFFVILQTDDDDARDEFNAKYALDVPVIADRDGRISDMCGIYATPQAVILNDASRIYFKGNYNKSRFCTHKQTRFVDIALDSLVAHRPLPVFVQHELTLPYGCELPSDTPDGEFLLSNLFNQ